MVTQLAPSDLCEISAAACDPSPPVAGKDPAQSRGAPVLPGSRPAVASAVSPWRLHSTVVALCCCELGARVCGVLSLLALTWSRFEMALWLAAAVNLLAALRGVIGGRATEHALHSVWGGVIDATRRRSLSGLRSRDQSQQLAALTEASGHVAHFRAAVVPRALAHVLGLALTAIAVVFWLGAYWLLVGLVLVVLVAPFVWFGYRNLSRRRQMSFEYFVEASANYGLLLDGATELRAHGVEARHAEQLNQAVVSMASAERKSYVIRSWLNAMPLAIGFAVMLFPLRDMLPGLVSQAGRMAEFGVLAAVGVSSLLGIVAALQGWAQARPFLASLARFLHVPERIREGGTQGVDVAGATIVFEHVSVHHDGATEGTPHAFSCRWSPERGLALLGDNGTGKSSLAWCLLGLLSPSSGKLSFGEVQSAQVNWSTIRSKLVFVPQHGFVAPERSIAWHLRLLSSSELSDEAIDRALEAVQLDRTLGRDAPLRNALVGDLSGGERKRVQLARALLGGPELIVLDEPEAGLDANSREWLKTFVQGLSEQCRVLLIAHDEKVIPESFQTVSCKRQPLAPSLEKTSSTSGEKK